MLLWYRGSQQETILLWKRTLHQTTQYCGVMIHNNQILGITILWHTGLHK